MFIMHSDLVSRVNNLVDYNLLDCDLGTPLSIFTINITLGNKNLKNYTIKCYVYIIVDQTCLLYCCFCISDILYLSCILGGFGRHTAPDYYCQTIFGYKCSILY